MATEKEIERQSEDERVSLKAKNLSREDFQKYYLDIVSDVVERRVPGRGQGEIFHLRETQNHEQCRDGLPLCVCCFRWEREQYY